MPRLRAMLLTTLIIASTTALSTSAPAAEPASNIEAKPVPFEIKDGDRIVFVGNTFVERALMYGYIETALTARFPNKTFAFRNLGWSGDNVKGESRARFGSVGDGFKHLIDHAKKIKPTHLIVSYGHNAAFNGESGIEPFIKDYKHLLDTLVKETGARVTLITPYPQEKKPVPLPDPSKYNKSLERYETAISKLAGQRKYALLSMSKLKPVRRCVFHEQTKDGKTTSTLFAQPSPITDNGFHLTRLGYWHAANSLFFFIEPREASWSIYFNKQGKLSEKAKHISDLKVTKYKITFTSKDEMLPMPTVPATLPDGFTVRGSTDRFWTRGRHIILDAAEPGRYEVRVDGKTIAKAQTTATSKPSRLLIWLPKAPEFQQTEQLRQAILKKNELFFHQWRPANETYIYLFRKHEQGRNAKEMPMFDPLIAAQETIIAKLKKPVAHKYEIIRVK
jgi:hypothetical protein